MSAFLQERDRNVIPRWRDFRNTVLLGELNTSATANKIPGPSHDLTSVTIDWRKHKTTSFAGDLISAALVSGDLLAAREASEFVVTLSGDVSPSLRTLALRVLHGNVIPDAANIAPIDMRKDNISQPSPEISSIRKRLVEHPSDAILWMDFAYLYVVRGLPEKAERAIRIALNLAPANRFVLRSAARFFIHRDRVDIAHDLIRKSPGYKNDPWLVAAEIAIALSAKRTPWATREGIALLNSDNFPIHHLSELNSALGTLEFHTGNSGKSKKFFKRSLKAPNDNSLAQARWISRDMSSLFRDVDVGAFRIARPFEASAYEAFVQADWKKSLSSALQWLEDEPFSSRPAALAGYLASTIFEDFSKSEDISNFSLIANPNNPGSCVTLAYCYASTGRTQEARDELLKIQGLNVEEWVHAAVDANYGLLAFRNGDVGLGRKFYAEAVRKAGLLDDKRTQISALIHWASEEIGLIDSNSERLLIEAREISKQVSSSEMPFLLKRLEKRIAERSRRRI